MFGNGRFVRNTVSRREHKGAAGAENSNLLFLEYACYCFRWWAAPPLSAAGNNCACVNPLETI
jgi:hypothetical protein